MPSKAKTLEKVAKKLGFKKVRQKGSHARWQHLDGRATTIPIHGNAEVIVQEWIETAKELGRDIPQPKERLIYA